MFNNIRNQNIYLAEREGGTQIESRLKKRKNDESKKKIIIIFKIRYSRKKQKKRKGRKQRARDTEKRHEAGSSPLLVKTKMCVILSGEHENAEMEVAFEA